LLTLEKPLKLFVIFVKICSVYIECKGDIEVVDVKQHKSQFGNLNFTVTQSAKFFRHCLIVMFEFLNCDLCCFIFTISLQSSFIAVKSNLKLNKM